MINSYRSVTWIEVDSTVWKTRLLQSCMVPLGGGIFGTTSLWEDGPCTVLFSSIQHGTYFMYPQNIPSYMVSACLLPQNCTYLDICPCIDWDMVLNWHTRFKKSAEWVVSAFGLSVISPWLGYFLCLVSMPVRGCLIEKILTDARNNTLLFHFPCMISRHRIN